jgi:hypothetical protein
MHLAFKLELDKTSALELPSFEPEEIDFWLNAAITRFVKTRYTGSDKGVGFEGNMKRIEDLRSLIVDDILLPVLPGSIRPNSWVYDTSTFSTERWFILGEEVDIEYIKLGDTNISTKRQGITECNISTYRSHIDDPYSEHRLHYEEAKPLRLIYGECVELITDGNYEPSFYYLRYLRKPITVSLTGDIDCDLPIHTHDEIVVLATNMVLENIEQPRYQTHSNELNKIE